MDSAIMPNQPNVTNENLTEMEEDDEEDKQDDLITIGRPESWFECFKMLFFTDEKVNLEISHPDGYLYLLFVKKASKLFLICKYSLFLTFCSVCDLVWAADPSVQTSGPAGTLSRNLSVLEPVRS